MNIETLRALPKTESLLAMEVLWQSLSSSANAEEMIPSWHQQVLSTRIAQLQAGTSTFIPWNKAKKQLQNLTKQPNPN